MMFQLLNGAKTHPYVMDLDRAAVLALPEAKMRSQMVALTVKAPGVRRTQRLKSCYSPELVRLVEGLLCRRHSHRAGINEVSSAGGRSTGQRHCRALSLGLLNVHGSLSTQILASGVVSDEMLCSEGTPGDPATEVLRVRGPLGCRGYVIA